MNRVFALGFVVFLFSAAFVLAAKPGFQPEDMRGLAAVEMKEDIWVPSSASEVAQDVFYLGKAVHKGRVVEGYAFVKYSKDEGSANAENGVGKVSSSIASSQCYGFLGNAKWRSVEPYLIKPVNKRGMDQSEVRNAVARSIGRWESAAGVNILGAETAGFVDGADTLRPDGKNEVLFGDVRPRGAIAITIVWGVFNGPLYQRRIVEWDQVYDHVDFDWSTTGQPGKMDFENIAMHELGHAVGMRDLYDSSCAEQTMYGYAGYGETKKRSLDIGDINGIRELY